MFSDVKSDVECEDMEFVYVYWRFLLWMYQIQKHNRTELVHTEHTVHRFSLRSPKLNYVWCGQ